MRAVPPRAGATARLSALVKAMEVGIVFRPSDYDAYLAKRAELPVSPVAGNDFVAGFEFSGSFAGRNIEKIYQLAEAAGLPCALEPTVRSCFERPRAGHALICSGFYVLHGKAAPRPGLAGGSCETDGPLGALAVLRAFAARGVPTSLFCDAHNGPVLQAGYEAMLQFFDREDPKTAAALREHSRCLPLVWDCDTPDEEPAQGAWRAMLDEHSATFPERPLPAPGSLRGRSLRVAAGLRVALQQAWGEQHPGPVDRLFALERLGAPYRNIRGRAIDEHTEPIDCLWPASPAAAAGEPSAQQPEAVQKMLAYFGRHDMSLDDLRGFRKIAGVDEAALSVGVGDGGNEVGLGRVALLDGVAQLRPTGDDSFVPLSENGCFRTCDHLLLGTVSNWAGSAFEMAAHALFEPTAVDYVAALRQRGRSLADLEGSVLDAVMARPTSSVDGVKPDQSRSVDGMLFEPNHRRLYDRLWELAAEVTGSA